jgi:hypothetical protein
LFYEIYVASGIISTAGQDQKEVEGKKIDAENLF